MRTSVVTQRVERGAFWLLLCALVWASWPLGSNRPWAVGVLAIAIWCAVAAVAVARAAFAGGHGAPLLRSGVRLAWLPIFGLTGFAVLLAAQLVPGLGDAGGTITVDAFHTRLYMLTTLVYLGAWLLVSLTVDSREKAIRLLAAVVLGGVLQAVAAILLYSSGGRYEFLFTTFEQGSRATGTFPNPDHLAGYMELCLAAGLGWLFTQFANGEGGEARGVGWRGNTVAVLSFIMSGKMLLRLLLMVMVIALVMTHSRMGNGAFFIALLIGGGLVALVSKQLRRPALWLVASMALVDVVIIGQWIGLGRLVERMQNTEVQSATADAATGLSLEAPSSAQREETLEQRLVIPRLSLRLAADRPWFGHGGGSYPTMFPAFKVTDAAGQAQYWDHAHNDYVQVACDTGFVGLGLWLVAGIASLGRAVQLLRDEQSRANRGFAVASLMAICTMGLHSMVDFNLHIPANALTFTALLAVVWAVPQAASRRRRRSGPAASRSTEPAEAVGAL